MRDDLVAILKQMFLTYAVKFGEHTLKSGKKSDIYLNTKEIFFRSEGISLIGRLIYESTLDLNFTCLGGMETGAIPIVSSALMNYHQAGKKMNGFFVRKSIKEHGNKSQIEGFVSAADRVVIVEDVTTTGKSVLDCISVVNNAGGRVDRVISICDREEGASEVLRNFDFRPILKLSEINVDLLRK